MAKRWKIWLVAGATLILCSVLAAGPTTAAQGPQRLVVLEVFTSG